MSKNKKLPALNPAKSKTITEKDRIKMEELFTQNARNRRTVKDFRREEDYSIIKANNFLSRVETIDCPDVIFAVADRIDHISKQNKQEKENRYKKADSPNFRTTNFKSVGRGMNEERVQAVTLAKWIDQKLQKFREKKSITFLDILDYKQTILNYALGKIIDSLTKKCREQGQLLSLIWNNTFSMFEGVFNILADANQGKEKEKIQDEKELQQLYEVNHNFLRAENNEIIQENQAIFEKMKNVIDWNKKLRKERKKLYTENRILNYRNHTYHLALEQNLEMLLRLVPQPSTILTAKKIIERLAKQKGRKKKFLHRESDEDFIGTTKEYVYRWLKRNSFVEEDMLQFFKDSPELKEDRFMMENLEDLDEIKRVNIYDYFRLYDIGVQVNAQTSTKEIQSEDPQRKNVEIMTKIIKTHDKQCQTMVRKQTKIEDIDRKSKKTTTKQSTHQKNISRDKSRKKIEMPSTKSVVRSTKKHLTNFMQQDKKIDEKSYHRISSRQPHLYKVSEFAKKNEKDDNTSIRRFDNTMVGFKIEENVSCFGEKEDMSISDDGQYTKRPTAKYFGTNRSFNSQQFQKSFKSIRDTNQECFYSPNGTDKFAQKLTRRKNKKYSVSYVSDRIQHRSITQLNVKKKFNEVYHENKKKIMDNKQEFYDQIVRRRSFYGKKRVQFANFNGAQEAKVKTKEFLRGRPIKNKHKTLHENSSYVYSTIEKITKKASGPSNMAKTKTLVNSQTVFGSIKSSIEQIARIPPSNKVFVNNSLISITKYIGGLIPDYIKQVKKEKEERISDDEKVLYPLNILLMEQMTFKYGLKDIAEKKIKNFIEKVLTFASISEKVELFSLLLGLQESEVGSDELLVYIKCLVYFEYKKNLRELTSIQSTVVDIEIARQNLIKVLEYFFDHEYVNLVELKLEIYFQQTAPFSTIEGITIIIIKELLKRKKELKQKYSSVYKICSVGDNFFTNLYKILKIIANYRGIAHEESVQLELPKKKKNRDSVESMGGLKKIKNRGFKRKIVQKPKASIIDYDITKINTIIKELVQRSDIMDEQFGKSITIQRFITAAVIFQIPTFPELQLVLEFFQQKFSLLKSIYPIYDNIEENSNKGLDQLRKLWEKENIALKEEKVANSWTLAQLFSEKIEDQVNEVMGKLGTIGLYVESSLLNLPNPK